MTGPHPLDEDTATTSKTSSRTAHAPRPARVSQGARLGRRLVVGSHDPGAAPG